MKKIVVIMGMLVLVMACGTYKSLDLNKLTTGMTKGQVIELVGSPERILAVNETENGLQEVLQYRTYADEIYALTFWNDYLTGYEFLYEDIPYIPSPVPPAIFPDYGRPIIIVPNPSRPNRPKPTPPRDPFPPSNTNPPVTRPPAQPEINRPEPSIPIESPSVNKPEKRPSEVIQTPSQPSKDDSKNNNRQQRRTK